MLSLGFFGVALFAFTMARYASGAERLAMQRGVDLANLAQINRLVIQDMQDGELVIDESERIRAVNPQAESYLGSIVGDEAPLLTDYAPQVAGRIAACRTDPQLGPGQNVTESSGKELRVRCVAVGDEPSRTTVGVLTDVSEQQKRMQQGKLAALGQLT